MKEVTWLRHIVGCSDAEPGVTALVEGKVMLEAGKKLFFSFYHNFEVCQAYQRLYLPCQFKICSGLGVQVVYTVCF